MNAHSWNRALRTFFNVHILMGNEHFSFRHIYQKSSMIPVQPEPGKCYAQQWAFEIENLRGYRSAILISIPLQFAPTPPFVRSPLQKGLNILRLLTPLLGERTKLSPCSNKTLGELKAPVELDDKAIVRCSNKTLGELKERFFAKLYHIQNMFQ